jgi:glycosyltransferase involved in cell wall biosynthesis
LRLAVVSPFLDRQHGTEMCIVEQIERFASQNEWAIELYSQQVSQMSGVQISSEESQNASAGIYWHKIPEIPGPHLLKFIWWFFANHWYRRRDLKSRKATADLVYTPGTNCLDADIIMIQIVFHAFYEQAREELQLRRVPLKTWPRLIHRRIYYQLIMFLERKIYRNPRICLIAVSNLIARQLASFLGRTDVVVIPNTVDTNRFNSETCRARRPELRKAFSFTENDVVALLIGNDWKKKGLDTLLRAIAALRDLPLRVMVVGKDDQGLYRELIQRLGLQGRVLFENPSADVVKFYAVSDIYVGPSLEDGFNLPMLEAMACGLPVIASSQAGASENITHGQTGLILDDPKDDALLARLIRQVCCDTTFRQKIAQAAAEFVMKNCNWDQNATRTRELMEQILRSRTAS